MAIAVNTTRRGVVLEDVTVVTPSISGPVTRIWFLSIPPAPTKLLYPFYDPDCNIPIYWSAAIGADNYELERAYNGGVYANIYTGTATNRGDLKVDPGIYRYRVRACNVAGCSGYLTGTFDCNAILSTCYRDGNTKDPNWSNWVSVGRPDCWCRPPWGSGYQCDGDVDGCTSGMPFNYRVFTGDTTIAINNYKKTAAQLTADPNVVIYCGHKIVGACADIDHKSTGAPFNYRVFTNDLMIIINNYRVPASRLPDSCPR
jgi:hypothetical protein